MHGTGIVFIMLLDQYYDMIGKNNSQKKKKKKKVVET